MSNVTAMELLLGRPEAALEHGRAAIARLDAFGASAGAGHPYHHVMTALILLNGLDDAVAAGRKAHAGRRRIPDAHVAGAARGRDDWPAQHASSTSMI
jgi:hypothetical protein